MGRGWKLTKDDDDFSHVIPLDDDKPHEVNTDCPCRPVFDTECDCYVHAAWDRREELEDV